MPQIPIVAIDSWAYGRLVFPNLNIVLYNVFSRSSATGPDIYGTEPATFYLANLFLNFNYLLPLALLSLPALAVTYKFDFRRLGTSQQAVKEGESSPYTLLVLRLAPFYLWLTTMSLQAHKEERFMYPLYPLLCMNAAVSIFLIKGWAETIYVKVTASPYNVSRRHLAGKETRLTWYDHAGRSIEDLQQHLPRTSPAFPLAFRFPDIRPWTLLPLAI
jgi:alpha-1,2-mannosyltransferase